MSILKRHKTTFDGQGFITDQGISKYWGVTRKDGEWYVSFKHEHFNRTINLKAKNCHLSEIECANVSAFFHESNELSCTVIANNREFYVDVNEGTIALIRTTSGEQAKLDFKKPVQPVQPVQHNHKKELDKLNKKDKTVLLRMIQIMKNKEMTTEGLDTLQYMINDHLNSYK